MTYTTIIKVSQLIYSLHTTIFFRMIEPSRTNGYVTFGSHPLVTICMAILQFTVLSITREYFACTKERPVSCTSKTIFITYPTTAWTTIREDNSLWLQFIQHFINLRIIIIILTVNGTRILSATIPTVTTIGSIKPYFKYLTVASHQFTKLFMEVIYIFR